MAKGGGLFQVYADPSPAGAHARPSGAVSSTVPRHKLSQARGGLGSMTVLGNHEKENVDPRNAPRAALKGKMGKAKIGAVGGKSADCVVKRPVSEMSVNGVCTGSLRTRELPPLDGDATNMDASTRSADFIKQQTSRQAVVDLAPPPGQLSGVGLGQVHDIRLSTSAAAYSPAHDSGYARSPRGNDDAEEMGEWNVDREDLGRDVQESPAAAVLSADRNARRLTESPLAEVTQAFTGLGRFSVAPNSPSPAPSTEMPPPSKARTAPVYRPSALKPTRKVKPASSGAAVYGGAAAAPGSTRHLRL